MPASRSSFASIPCPTTKPPPQCSPSRDSASSRSSIAVTSHPASSSSSARAEPTLPQPITSAFIRSSVPQASRPPGVRPSRAARSRFVVCAAYGAERSSLGPDSRRHTVESNGAAAHPTPIDGRRTPASLPQIGRRRRPKGDRMTQMTSEQEQETSSGAESSVGQVAEQAQAKVQEKAGQATEAAGRAIREQVSTRSTQASEQLRSYTDALRQTAEQLDSDGKSSAANAANTIVDRLERSAGYLERSEPDQLLHAAEDFGRRNPWVVIAAGVGMGLVGARFLKASSSRRYQTSSYGTSSYPLPP